MTLLFIFAFFIWIVRPSWLMLLWLVTIPILAPLMILNSGINDTEGLLGFLLQLWGVFQRLFLIIVFYQLFFKHKVLPKGLSTFLIPCGLLCVYFLFHNGIRHFDATALYQNIAGACYHFLPILVMILDKRVRPNLKAVFGVLVLIVAIQLVMVPFNLEGIVVYTMRYQDKTFLQEELGLVSGTFSQSNALADFLSVMYLFLCVDFFSRKTMSKKLFFIVSAVVLLLLALTGSKMPIVCSIMTLFMCILLFKRQMILPIIGTFVVLLFLIILSWKSIEKLGVEYRGVDRFVSGMTAFIESKNGGKDDETTLRLSSALISRYFPESPIIGCGYAYKGQDKAYPVNLNTDFGLTNYEADATLALYVVEYGLIGIFLFLWYYFTLIKFSVSQTYSVEAMIISIIIFTFLLAFSITECGLFYRPNFFYFYMYIFGVQRWKEEQQRLVASCP